MSIAVVRSISCLAATVVAITAFGASATTILVDFENDATGVNVLNDFESVDSSRIHLSDTMSTNLFVIEETIGVNNALLVAAIAA